MNDKQLISFITVANKGSFSQAAQVLFIAPQTLIAQMNQLEQEAGAKLFVRNKKGVSLTEAGDEFYHGAQGILSLISETIEKSRKADKSKQEVIRIGFSPIATMVIPETTIAFSALYPEITIQLVPIAANDWVSLLCEELVDVLEGDMSITFNGLPVETTCLLQEPRVAILAPSHPLAKYDLITNDALSEFNIYTHNRIWLNSCNKEFKTALAKATIIEKPCTLVNVFDACLNGGVYLAAARFAKAFRPLITRPLEIDRTIDIGIAYRARHHHAVELFIEVAKNLYKTS